MTRSARPRALPAAAALAVRRGAQLILGPLFTAEVRPALAAVAGKVPLVAFSNDEALVESGAFLLGITARQLAASVIGYAAGGGCAASSCSPARTPGGGRRRPRRATSPRPRAWTWAWWTRARSPAPLCWPRSGCRGGGDLPDAVFVPDGGARLVEAARAVAGSDVQLLGTLQGLDPTPRRSPPSRALAVRPRSDRVRPLRPEL
jgi:hypothetical protein